MTEIEHPKQALKRLVSQHASDARAQRLRGIYEVCETRYKNGERDFTRTVVGKALQEAAVLACSTYLSKYPTSDDYRAIGSAWQAYCDAQDLALDPNAPDEHPDSVVQRLLSMPGRRGNASAKLREVHKVCRERFNRGEQNFSPAAVSRDFMAAGLSTAPIKANGRVEYGELLEAWQALADARSPMQNSAVIYDDPDAVVANRLRERRFKAPSFQYLEGLHSVCQARYDRGEWDFGTVAVAEDLIAAGVFKETSNLTVKLRKVPRYQELLSSWQAKRDKEWINGDPDLPPTHPHAVFQRLRPRNTRADTSRILLGVHWVCHEHYATGSLDFSHATIGKLISTAGVAAERHIFQSQMEDARTLVGAWSNLARPWLADDNGVPPPVEPRRQKAHDMDLEWVRRDYPEFEEWRVLAARWLYTVKAGLAQRIAMFARFFEDYLSRPEVPTTPAELLRRGGPLPSFMEVSNSADAVQCTRHNYLCDFLDWVLLDGFSDESDNGDLVVSSAFRNPLKRASKTGGAPNNETTKSPLPYGYIAELRSILAPGPDFKDWKFAQSALGVNVGGMGAPAPDWITVDPSVIDRSDPDCVWRKRHLKEGKVDFQIWSPVRWVALLVKLLTPLRTHQVRVLDSGESDTWKYAGGEWVKNDHPLAGKIAAATKKVQVHQQGVLRRSLINGAIETLLYINTNKTADQQRSGPEKGYEMPWFVDPNPTSDVHHWFEKLRNWQTKYNPVKRRVSWTELDARHIHAKTKDQRRSYPDACFLFRLPENSEDERMLPVPDSHVDYAWFNLLEHFQDLLAARGEVHPDGSPIVFAVRDERGRAKASPFPLHSLRVSLITALALEGGVPFPILQKVVGHSRLLMTLYYTKPGHSHIAGVLKDAAVLMDSKKEATIYKFLLNAEHKSLVDRAVANSPDALAMAIPIQPAARNAAGWMSMHLGVCVVGGNVSEVEDNRKIGGCYNGGPRVGQEPNGPVPGGSRNCVRCRWLVTEPHYLPSLVAQFNNHAYHFSEARIKAMDAERVYEEMKIQKASVEAEGQVFEERREFAQRQRLMETAMKTFGDSAENVVATWRLIERCLALLNQGGGDGDELVIQGEVGEIQAKFENVNSELLQLCGVCEGAELYPDLDAGKAVVRRSQLLDRALYSEGLPPMLMTLTEDQQMKVGNALVRKLSRLADPQNPFLGERKVVSAIEAGQSLGEHLGIDLKESLADLQLKSLARPAKRRLETIEE